MSEGASKPNLCCQWSTHSFGDIDTRDLRVWVDAEGEIQMARDTGKGGPGFVIPHWQYMEARDESEDEDEAE